MLRSKISSWREYLTPVTHKSTFFSSGEITPEEFTLSGDYLTHMFPTWRWNGNEESLKNASVRDFLPEGKQFLVTRKVPSSVRANAFFEAGAMGPSAFIFDEEELSKSTADTDPSPLANPEASQDIDEAIGELEISESIGSRDGDDDEIIIKSDENKRYYDLYITYSTSYRVPKMYIVGYNAQGSPLTADEMFEDITKEYRHKTATIEKLPFYKGTVISVSIHPCKHANVMKVLLEKIRQVKKRERDQTEQSQLQSTESMEDDWEDLQDDINDTLRVDQYLVVFLKFITGIIPSIEHDYTMEGW
ncbi:Atg3p KNAG_0D00610 [Huiozyma naganishii CBS 8797]|uniref:Autophagy-related protein 3 n=1 Tax=Huiozyma naganishii (strain ATCC MYA-139 / BCRC 22969 / CBS 8797 / KCTC 17520 / NBRC 10181 / NCYC 3082 / Yp74L-3) TaxID=1071383 RepID=J7RJX8_HUIN7|nr:hypothetical protein KNAG_0D00610 [Kazachstania naganishii CBS 8797]CCK69813.1 hypothetical protein KNAG_0D00610 [Kazachstania naganishii CBS 8797]